MGRRTLLLITSVLLAAVGTAIVAIYVRDAGNRATRNEAVGTFVVAARPIEDGTTITADDVRTRSLRAGDQLGTTAKSLDDVIGRRATAEILPDTTIDLRALAEPGAEADDGAIRKGELGVDVELGDPERAISLLGVGSQVRIFTLAGAEGEATVLVRAARVISIGATLDGSGAAGPDGANEVGSPAVPATVVGLSVRPEIAGKIAAARLKQEPMYFTVIPSIDVSPEP